MEFVLPLDQMTVDEKLRALEQIWEDLCRNEADLPSPQWHREILEVREARSKQGMDRFTDWGETKRQIREAGS